jgi:ABC-type uncharacterized transport system permease subunit
MTINIPPRLRFALYVGAAFAGIAGAYFADKAFTWWGPAEAKALAGVIALINILAASKVTIEAQSADTNIEE